MQVTVSAFKKPTANSLMVSLALLTLLVSLPATVRAFEIEGIKWTGATTEFYFDLPGLSPTGISWNAAFLDALQEWNGKTVFEFVPFNQYRNPCVSDFLNGVDFTSDSCGSEFGSNTLAVTLRLYQNQVLGPPRLVESDIVFNEAIEYNIFDGNIPQFGIPPDNIDFRRVALHELGHALGLDHENLNDAIMAPTIGNLDRLQADDIAGANALYSGLANCEIKPATFGSQSDALEASDCTVAELTVGGDDTSFIDVYELSVDSITTVDLQMTSETLDSVLLLANSSLEYIGFDNKLSGECDSSLSTVLEPGTYYVLANSYVEPVREDCGNTGSYQLVTSYSSAEQQQLGQTVSALGTDSTARFFGGISADGGVSFGNAFTANQRLDISAEIQVDVQHQGRDGFLVVAAVIEEQILVLNDQGQFLPFDPATGLETVQNKALEATETLVIAEGLVPSQFDVQSISVDFLVGYGLDENPAELYYHETPINLTVSP